MKINIKALTFAVAFFWGVGVFLITWWVILFDGATGEPTWLASMYRGYNISPSGSIIGLLWGLADGALSGLILGWLYNMFVDRFSTPK
ncbi:MAG: bacteriophage holin [Bdellovibrionota bacterium]